MIDGPIASVQRSRPQIMASLLTADMARLGEECRALEAAGIDGIHWDIMHGVAVPALSFGPDVVHACRKVTELPFEAHVMSRAPDGMIDPLARAGCLSLTIHPDWVPHPRRLLQRIADAGMAPGVALSPDTTVDYAEWHLDIAALVLVMSVEPGFRGQAHLPSMTRKVARVGELLSRHSGRIVLEVDGGIDVASIRPMAEAGATRFVVGSAIWRAPSYADALAAVRGAWGDASATAAPGDRHDNREQVNP